MEPRSQSLIAVKTSFSLGTCLTTKRVQDGIGCFFPSSFFSARIPGKLNYPDTFITPREWSFLKHFCYVVRKFCPFPPLLKKKLIYLKKKKNTLVCPEEIPLLVTTPLLCCSASVAQTLTSQQRLVPLSWHVHHNKTALPVFWDCARIKPTKTLLCFNSAAPHLSRLTGTLRMLHITILENGSPRLV